MKDYCSYVDCFYGNGETDRFITSGIGSKWFYIKAQCGNTIPHATLPFSEISVGAYSSGYPGGYGTHYPNSCGGIKKLTDKMTVRGFSHMHHSGVGGIGYYYNYAIVTPFVGDLAGIYDYAELSSETACPGYYNGVLRDIDCEFTVMKGVALHKYSFKCNDGKIAVDFSNNGLSKLFGNRFYSVVNGSEIEVIDSNVIGVTGDFSGVKLHFAVKVESSDVDAKIFIDDKIINNKTKQITRFKKGYGGAFTFNGNQAMVKVAFSTVSLQKAVDKINDVKEDFSTAKNLAYQTWNNYLGKIDVETDSEDLKVKFYSNFYHSLVKPTMLKQEEILGVKGDIVTDISTFWDTYKTVFPLQMLLYEDLAKSLINTIKLTSETYKKVPCSLGLSNFFNCEQQAKMLAVYTLLDAYHYGIENATLDVVESVFKTELKRADFASFLKKGYFDRYTHILDVTDACLNLAELTKDENFKNSLEKLAKNWKNAYDSNGILSDNSPYYEGDKYTYSFRLQKNMEERVELSGGKQNFEKQLDDFFGFCKDSVSQVREIEAFEEIGNKRYHRFQGFNNECDMETPYAYIYAGNHDKLCDIVYECVNKSFGLGKGGLPGNNDSGGLSSCFIWNALGLFPVSGSGEFLVGAPSFKKATIKLFNGNVLTILAENLTKPYGYVKSIYFNGEEITIFKLKTANLIKGGTLKFIMK